MHLLRSALAGAALALAAAPLAAQPRRSAGTSIRPADLVVVNATVYTVDDSRPTAEAIAVRDGRIMFVGSRRGVDAITGPATKVVDAHGGTVIPGMTDAHAHFMGLGQALRTVDLTGTTSYQQVIDRVVARAKTVPAGTWIIGRGWDQNDWGDTRFPTHDALSRAVPNNPVLLERVDGHAQLANAKAMQLAGITAQTRDPEGGRLERDASGAPTGVFVDNANGLVERAVPAPSKEELRARALAAIDEMHRWGLTGIHDAGEPRANIELFEQLAKEGKLELRTYAMVADDSAALDYYFARGPQSALYDGRLWIRAVKLYADGALGSRGAALLEPYADDPHNTGLLVSPPAHIEAVAERALRAGFQVCVHAIGDRGNRVVLDAFEQALKAAPVADHRFRIEHAQIVNYADIPRFAQLDVIPSMQAVHQTSDMYWAGSRLGPGRELGAYAWRSLLNTGVVIPNGSDFPVEGVNPLRSFHAAISRQDEHGWPPGGWHPEQVMTREEALKSMTIWPAYASFMEKDAGSLTPGKYADFVILDRDIMTIAPNDVLGTGVVATYLAGKAVYERR
ncbi:MAG: amidohydrolase [Gemmatimonadaceae bacterium]|nr:amidohydrolase [Gemmatimonadaceae bacterium]